MLRGIIAATDDQQRLCNVGAGPLEDLVHYHGAAFIDRIERAARNDTNFRVALSCVWAWESPVRPRIEAVLSASSELPRT